MVYIYNDISPPRAGGGFVPYDRIKATEGYLRHFWNLMYLEFIAKHKDTSFREKQQAEREMVIAKRKMDWHKKHPNFNLDIATQEVARIKKEWAGDPSKHEHVPRV